MALLLLPLRPLAAAGSGETLQYTLSYLVQSPEVKLLALDASAEAQATVPGVSWGELRILDVNIGVRSIPILYGTTVAKTGDGTYFTFFPLRLGVPLHVGTFLEDPFAWAVLLTAELDWNRLNATDVPSAARKYPLLDARLTVALPIASAYLSFRKTVFDETPARTALFDGLFLGVDVALGSPVRLDLSRFGTQGPQLPGDPEPPPERPGAGFRRLSAAGADRLLYLGTVPADAAVAGRSVALYGLSLLSAAAPAGGTLSVVLPHPDGTGTEWRISAADHARYLAGQLADRSLAQALRSARLGAEEMAALSR